jgi:hypothetical protein
MNSSIIGDEGTNAVKSYLNRLGYIQSFIATFDTMPVWDGQLLIYSDQTNFTKDKLLYEIPVQVKSHQWDSDQFPEYTRFSINLDDLRAYRQDGGTIFFNVLVGTSQNKVYCEFLTKSKIDKLLDTAKGSASRSVRLNSVPKSATEFLTSARTLHLQRTHSLIPFEKAKKYKDVLWAIDTYGLKDGDNPLSFITTHPVNVLAYIEGNTDPLYVGDDIARISSVIDEATCNVSSGDTVFYSGFTRIYENGNVNIKVGKSFSLQLTKDEKGLPCVNVNITLKADSLSEIIHELKFIQAIHKHQVVDFDDFKLEIPIKDDSQFLLWEEALCFWLDVQNLFNFMHIEVPLENIQDLNKQEINRLKTLIKGLLYNQDVIGINGLKEDHLEWVSISNLKVVIFARYIKDNKYKLNDIYTSLTAFYIDNGKHKLASIYSKVIAEEVLADNIEWPALVKSYQKVYESNPDFIERANWDVLTLIKLYDKYKRPSILATAKELHEWVKSVDDSWQKVRRLNELQISIRESGQLTESEINELYDLYDTTSSNDLLSEDEKISQRFAISVLLQNYNQSCRYFEKMSDEQKEFTKQLPIYHLYENLIEQHNG